MQKQLTRGQSRETSFSTFYCLQLHYIIPGFFLTALWLHYTSGRPDFFLLLLASQCIKALSVILGKEALLKEWQLEKKANFMFFCALPCNK